MGCVDVVAARVPYRDTIEVRAKALHEFLEKRFPQPTPINIIAHSMGGLDARHMISLLPPSRQFTVKSLTTLATVGRVS